MKFKFWGVRGSIATPGPKTLKYGGNTTCIEVRTDDNNLIILDAGTGAHILAQDLLAQMPLKAHILITHTHWDHIQGLPFFTPMYIPNNAIHIYGGRDMVTGQGIKRALDVQHQYSFFPIPVGHLKAEVHYQDVNEGVKFKIAEATITPITLNHPVINFGYRIDCDGQSLFFTGDYEQQYNIYSPEDTEYEGFQESIDERLSTLVDIIQGVDALIIDSSFTSEEYTQKRGWGHGSYEAAIELATRAQVKQLYLTHHEPTRSDAELDVIYAELLENHPNLNFELHLALEGLEVLL